jgi:cell division protein YceG involved in septum cleavage
MEQKIAWSLVLILVVTFSLFLYSEKNEKSNEFKPVNYNREDTIKIDSNLNQRKINSISLKI